jgi:hypothetical protein
MGKDVAASTTATINAQRAAQHFPDASIRGNNNSESASHTLRDRYQLQWLPDV